MSRNDGSGCAVIIVVIIVIALILFLGAGFLGNFSSYMRTGNKGTADTAGVFFLLLAGVVYFVYRVFKSGK